MRRVEMTVDGKRVMSGVYIADSFVSRFLGLMGKKSISEDEAVCFPRCNSIHTFFMRFPIDVVLLDTEGRVVRLVEAMKPWRLLLPKSRVHHVIELRARRSRELGIREGARVACEGVSFEV